MVAAVVEGTERIRSVHLEGLALLKIVKHCHDALPHMVTGSLLGLCPGNGVLEVTHAFPFPEPSSASSSSSSGRNRGGEDRGGAEGDPDGAGGASASALNLDGHEYQLEMMRMLREVNVDNNCVGWYQSTYLGTYSSSSLLENQLSYQLDLSPNAVVLLYDPIQTRNGHLALRCFRLSDRVVRIRAAQGQLWGGSSEGGAPPPSSSSAPPPNAFVDPRTIFEPVPIRLTNPGLARALLSDLAEDGSGPPPPSPSSSSSFSPSAPWSRLDLSTHPYLEKNLELACAWIDDLALETQKVQAYARQLGREARGQQQQQQPGGGPSRRPPPSSSSQMSTSADAPRRLEGLLVANQVRQYCEQMSDFASGGLTKLFVASSAAATASSSSGAATTAAAATATAPP